MTWAREWPRSSISRRVKKLSWEDENGEVCYDREVMTNHTVTPPPTPWIKGQCHKIFTSCFFPRISLRSDHHQCMHIRQLIFDYVTSDKLVGVDTDTGDKVYAGFLFVIVAGRIALATILLSSVNDASDQISNLCQWHWREYCGTL